MKQEISNKKFLKEKNKDASKRLADINPVLLGATEVGRTEADMVFKNNSEDNPHERKLQKAQPIVIASMGKDEAQNEVEELEQMFSGDGQTESSILKELFNSKNIKVKTELTADQVSIVSRLFLMADITKRPYLGTVLNEFITLQVSKDRKSRMEFVEAHRDRQQNMNKGIFGNMFGGGQNGG